MMNEPNKCFNCGETNGNFQKHHVIPKILGGKATVTLCEKCHGLLHGLDFLSHKELTKAGLIKARENGAILGRPKTKIERINTVKALREINGLPFSKISEIMGCSRVRAFQLYRCSKQTQS